MTDPTTHQPERAASDPSTAPEQAGEGPTRYTTPPLLPGATPSSPLPQQFGRYRILRELGRGGMGTVYLARDTRLDRDVALKVPHREIAADPQALARFYREARSAAHLHHPNICQVYDVDQLDGVTYLTTAFIDGSALSTLVPTFQDRPREAVQLVRKLALALSEAHVRGVIHRDLKPSNVLIEPNGEPVVMDFGLARRVEAKDSSLSVEGMILGTPAYMAPEQARGEVSALGPLSDVYSLGVLFYELLTGRPPFRGTVAAVLAQVLVDPVPPPSQFRPGLDARLEMLCLKALARRPEDRFGGMRPFAEALDGWLSGSSTAGPEVGAAVETPTFKADRQFVDEILTLLRRWGWEKGIETARRRYPAPVTANVDQSLEAALIGWLAGVLALREVIEQRCRVLPEWAALQGWAILGEANAAANAYQFERATTILSREAPTVAEDSILQASLAQLRAYLLYQHHQYDDSAIPLLHQALDLFGPNHFETGKVLSTLGLVYGGKGNFMAAREFLEQAIRCKRAVNDDAGLASAHQRLGRLFLQWRLLNEADEHFQAALKLARKRQAEADQADLFNDLSRVLLVRLDEEPPAGRHGPSRGQLILQATDYLDRCLRYNEAKGRTVEEAWACKDRALLFLLEGKVAEAEACALKAEQRFQLVGLQRGVVDNRTVLAQIWRKQGRFEESTQAFRDSLTHYDLSNRHAEAARTQLGLARTLQLANAPRYLVIEAFREALERAEFCRRSNLVRVVEDELKAVDEETYWRHIVGRLRGRGHPHDTSSLVEGESETATVLFLNLRHFSAFCQGLDAEAAMLALNQILADMTAVLDRYQARITCHLGGGFMALVRNTDHAERAVHAALDLLQVASEFNRPRVILGLRLLPVSIGIASGAVCLGNIGTYYKLEFTAVGIPATLAAWLMRQADSSAPCISQETYHMVQDRFLFREGNPRRLEHKSLGFRDVYDVIGRKEDPTSGFSRR